MNSKCNAAPLAEDPQAGPSWQEQGVDVDMYFSRNILMYTIVIFHIVIFYIFNALHVCALLCLPVCVTSSVHERCAPAYRRVLITQLKAIAPLTLLVNGALRPQYAWTHSIVTTTRPWTQEHLLFKPRDHHENCVGLKPAKTLASRLAPLCVTLRRV